MSAGIRYPYSIAGRSIWMPRVTSGRSSAAATFPARRNTSAKRRLVLDQVVGREDGHHLVLGAVDCERGQRDRRGGVAARRLEDDPGIRHLVPHEVGVGRTDDDPDAGEAPGTSPSRSTVRWMSVRSSSNGRNGLGRSARLSGRSRVPPPPARITAYIPEIVEQEPARATRC